MGEKDLKTVQLFLSLHLKGLTTVSSADCSSEANRNESSIANEVTTSIRIVVGALRSLHLGKQGERAESELERDRKKVSLKFPSPHTNDSEVISSIVTKYHCLL